LTKIKAVLFDLHWTLVYVEEDITDEEVSEYLFSKGYEVSPQQWKVAWSFVSFIDYPRFGYKTWRSYLSRILWRLGVKADKETLENIIDRFKSRSYKLQWDAAGAAERAKHSGFRTAIVTTIAYFKFRKIVSPIREYFDFIMTGYEAGCDKANPRMYRKILEALNVRPEEAVMIGDDVQTDVLLPKRLGMKAILLDREKKNVQCPLADAIVNDLNEAMEIVIRKLDKS